MIGTTINQRYRLGTELSKGDGGRNWHRVS
jgi:hypothetical protein